MLDRVTISHRGASYEIGQGRGYYGIWAVGAPRSQPLGRWPLTSNGWYEAWAHFATIEVPGTVVPVGQPREQTGRWSARDAAHASARADAGAGASPAGFATTTATSGELTARRGAAVLLLAGAALGVASMFPDYLAGSSLVQQPAELVPHVLDVVLWAGASALLLLGAGRTRAGALLAAATSLVTFGFFFADAGSAVAGRGQTAGAGLVLGCAGWAVATLGAAYAVRRFRPVGLPTLPQGNAAGLAAVAVAVVAALGAAITFAPSWDSYTLRAAATGQVEHFTAGNAFSNPGLVIAGDVIVMVAFVVTVALAVLWRPVVGGAVLLLGAVVPMAAQVVSALVQFAETTSPTQFGVSSAQAAQVRLQVSNGLTPDFVLYACLVGVLLVLGARLLLPARRRALPYGTTSSSPYRTGMGATVS